MAEQIFYYYQKGIYMGKSLGVEIMEYMVWIVEIVADRFFEDDKTLTYKTLKERGIWELYVEHFEVTHTLGKEYILEEIGEMLAAKGVI